MHPKRSSSQQSRVTSSNLYSIHPRQLAIPLKHGYAGNVSARFSVHLQQTVLQKS
jgi:hypothetical protein